TIGEQTSVVDSKLTVDSGKSGSIEDNGPTFARFRVVLVLRLGDTAVPRCATTGGAVGGYSRWTFPLFPQSPNFANLPETTHRPKRSWKCSLVDPPLSLS
ncbi:MAG: hypothetical protein AAF394_15585, partial [Planctomycetota bacterium]